MLRGPLAGGAGQAWQQLCRLGLAPALTCAPMPSLADLLPALRQRARELQTGAGPAAAAEGLGSAADGPAHIFDRQVKRAHRERAARLQRSDDPLLTAVSEALLDRLEDCTRSFPRAAVIGGAALQVLPRLAGGRKGLEEVTYMDTSPAMLARAEREWQAAATGGGRRPELRLLEGDEEHSPLELGHYDLVLTSLGFHWVNDLPGAMIQCRRALRPDGLFLSAMWGGDTLQELRIALSLAEQECEGGISPRISPLAQVRDAGNLLTRAGLSIPSVDVDDLAVHYAAVPELVQHLRAMGESNAVRVRRPRLGFRTLARAEEIYRERFGDLATDSLPATYQAIYLTGWGPSGDQAVAARRGSATVSLEQLAALQGLKEPGPPE